MVKQWIRDLNEDPCFQLKRPEPGDKELLREFTPNNVCLLIVKCLKATTQTFNKSLSGAEGEPSNDGIWGFGFGAKWADMAHMTQSHLKGGGLTCDEYMLTVHRVKRIVCGLSAPHFESLKLLARLCVKVTDHNETSHMTPYNLAVCLFHEPSKCHAWELCVEHFSYIFEGALEPGKRKTYKYKQRITH